MSARKYLVVLLLLGAVLVVTACNMSLPQGDSGSIVLVPFWDEEQGIQGVTTSQDWTVQAELIQLSIPGGRDQAIAIVLEQTSLSELPPPAGTYRGKALDWDLYSAELQIRDAGPQTLHVDLALAEGEAAAYIVTLVTLPSAYETNPALYETVFTHALYGLEPLERN